MKRQYDAFTDEELIEQLAGRRFRCDGFSDGKI